MCPGCLSSMAANAQDLMSVDTRRDGFDPPANDTSPSITTTNPEDPPPRAETFGKSDIESDTRRG
jgi:hypothetical protein